MALPDPEVGMGLAMLRIKEVLIAGLATALAPIVVRARDTYGYEEAWLPEAPSSDGIQVGEPIGDWPKDPGDFPRVHIVPGAVRDVGNDAPMGQSLNNVVLQVLVISHVVHGKDTIKDPAEGEGAELRNDLLVQATRQVLERDTTKVSATYPHCIGNLTVTGITPLRIGVRPGDQKRIYRVTALNLQLKQHVRNSFATA